MPSAASRRSLRCRMAVVEVERRLVGRVDPLGEVPVALTALAPAIATCPRRARASSILVMLRLLVQPDDGHGSTLVSGMSRESSGPSASSSARMSRRKESLVASHAAMKG